MRKLALFIAGFGMAAAAALAQDAVLSRKAQPAGAGWSGTVIALTKGRGSNAGGVDFYQYQSVDQWRVGNEQRYCAYASRQ